MMELSAKETKWLEIIYLASRGSGMYPGEREDLIPGKIVRSLESKGLIERFIPHNPVHKERFVTTLHGAELAKPAAPSRKFKKLKRDCDLSADGE